MIIGIPRERKQGESRVAMTPDGTDELTKNGHLVLIETNAGLLSGFSNEEYVNAGGVIVESLEEVWGRADIIVKVKEPSKEEIPLFRPGLTVFCFLHLAAFPELTKEMVDRGITGLDYDLVMLDDGRLPLLEPMSIIAGKLSIQCGAYALQADQGGCGLLLGGSLGVAPARVVVIGAGVVGACAVRIAQGMGAEVTVLDIDTAKLSQFANNINPARTVFSTPSSLERELVAADLVIGAVLIPGALAPKLIKRSYLEGMKNGAVIVDVCIDQGGISETSRPTSHAEPTYVEDGVIHYCVPNMPALVPRTSTKALTSATLPYITMIAEYGVENAIQNSVPLRRSLTSFKGNLTNPVIGKELGMASLSKEETEKMLIAN
jgi:alanine dehydrogenase